MGRGVSRNLFKKIQFSEFWDTNFQPFENETNFVMRFDGFVKKHYEMHANIVLATYILILLLQYTWFYINKSPHTFVNIA